MHDARRYRDNAAGCLLAAQQARQPYCRKLRLSMAASWLSLAHRDEAIDNLFCYDWLVLKNEAAAGAFLSRFQHRHEPDELDDLKTIAIGESTGGTAKTA